MLDVWFGFFCFVFVVVGCCVGGWDRVLVVGGCFFTVSCVYFFVEFWGFVLIFFYILTKVLGKQYLYLLLRNFIDPKKKTAELHLREKVI